MQSQKTNRSSGTTSTPKRILFITGTRADFGKLKPLIRVVEKTPDLNWSLFVTGMHNLSRYGYTTDEIYKVLPPHRMEGGFQTIHTFFNQCHGEPMDQILANTIQGLSRYVNEFTPDMIVVHGDRIETLAGAIVGSLRNILVAHVEGGEISGTIDELIRHSVTKLAHLHFVANQEAANRLKQLGENPECIFVTGSPDIDVMLSSDLPSLEEVKRYYQIPYQNYALAIFHPVTTDVAGTARIANNLVNSLIESNLNYILIYPNNDQGCEEIFNAYKRCEGNSRFLTFSSIRFEYFLTLLRHAKFVIGNSSVGVREAPVYGTYTINVGSRQKDRFHYQSIIDVERGDSGSILTAIQGLEGKAPCPPSHQFGKGNSAELFALALKEPLIWNTARQKRFYDVAPSSGEGL